MGKSEIKITPVLSITFTLKYYSLNKLSFALLKFSKQTTLKLLQLWNCKQLYYVSFLDNFLTKKMF